MRQVCVPKACHCGGRQRGLPGRPHLPPRAGGPRLHAQPLQHVLDAAGDEAHAVHHRRLPQRLQVGPRGRAQGPRGRLLVSPALLRAAAAAAAAAAADGVRGGSLRRARARAHRDEHLLDCQADRRAAQAGERDLSCQRAYIPGRDLPVRRSLRRSALTSNEDQRRVPSMRSSQAQRCKGSRSLESLGARKKRGETGAKARGARTSWELRYSVFSSADRSSSVPRPSATLSMSKSTCARTTEQQSPHPTHRRELASTLLSGCWLGAACWHALC